MSGIFAVPEFNVVAATRCTWCAADVGERCMDRQKQAPHTHAQRWRDFWNATHERSGFMDVYRAPWRDSTPTSERRQGHDLHTVALSGLNSIERRYGLPETMS